MCLVNFLYLQQVDKANGGVENDPGRNDKKDRAS